MRTYRVGVVGCGNIGSLWDERSPDPKFPKTHIGAILAHPRLELIGACDISSGRLNEAQKHWGLPWTTTELDQLLALKPEVLAFATPPAAGRKDVIERALRAGVRGILCEKPAALDLEEARAIQALIAGTHVRFAVNYIRRFDKNLQLIKQLLTTRRLGDPTKVVCHYGKGLKNNGSHMIDLLVWYFGTPLEVSFQGTVPDVLPEDPTVHVTLIYQTHPVFLTAQSSRDYTAFELDIFLSKGRVRILNAGRDVEISEVAPDPDFPDYQILRPSQSLGEGLRGTLPAAYQQLIEALDHGGSPLTSTIDDSVNVFKIIRAIETAMSAKDKTCKLES